MLAAEFASEIGYDGLDAGRVKIAPKIRAGVIDLCPAKRCRVVLRSDDVAESYGVTSWVGTLTKDQKLARLTRAVYAVLARNQANELTHRKSTRNGSRCLK